MLKLDIPIHIFNRILEQGKAEAPIEACGILAGNNSKVKKLYKMTNVDNSRTHFMMAPGEQFKVMKDIRSAGLKMLAIYHSHPATPARVSKEDIRLALTPDIVYVIISLQAPGNPVTKGFVIEDGNITEVPVAIVKQ